MIWAGGKLRVWPGRPAPLGAHWDGAGTNFAVFSGSAANEGGAPDEHGGVTLCCSTRTCRGSGSLPERAVQCGTATCPTSAPGSATGTASPDRACVGDLQDRQAPARPVRQGVDRLTALDRLGPAGLGRRVGSGLGSRHAPVGGRQPVVRLGPGPSSEHAVASQRALRGPRPRHDPAAPRRRPRAARHLLGPVLAADHRAPARSKVTAVELVPVHQFMRPAPDQASLHHAWGNSIEFLRPRHLRRQAAAGAHAGSSGSGQALQGAASG